MGVAQGSVLGPIVFIWWVSKVPHNPLPHTHRKQSHFRSDLHSEGASASPIVMHLIIQETTISVSLKPVFIRHNAIISTFSVFDINIHVLIYNKDNAYSNTLLLMPFVDNTRSNS